MIGAPNYNEEDSLFSSASDEDEMNEWEYIFYIFCCCMFIDGTKI